MANRIIVEPLTTEDSLALDNFVTLDPRVQEARACRKDVAREDVAKEDPARRINAQAAERRQTLQNGYTVSTAMAVKRTPTEKSEKPAASTSRPRADTAAMLEKVQQGGEAFFPWWEVGSFARDGHGRLATENNKMVKAYITEHWYNDWYHNTSIVVGTCFFAWLAAYVGLCWWALGLVFFCTGSVYRAEMRRFARNTRDDLVRVTTAENLDQRPETTAWLNTFLAKFWVIYMPVLSQQVKEAVNPQLAGTAPGYGIDALTLDEFTLGSKAPTIDEIRSYPKKGANVVEMDWKFSFTPNDVADMTAKEVKNKVNPKIALGVTVGKGFVSKSLPILVEDINVAGRMRITLLFGDTFPNIKTASISFLEPPMIDFALKPVGGDTLGLDIMSFLPGLKSFVKGIIDSNLRPMLYAPNKMDIDVEEIMAAQSQDAIGVVAVTLKSAQGLKMSGTVNPFIELTTDNEIVGIEKEVRSKVINDSKAPNWDETKFVLVNTLQQKLHLKCFHMGGYRKSNFIGEAEFDLSELYQQSEQEGLVYELENGGKSKGILKCDIRWFPVASADKDKEKDKEKQKEKLKEDGKDSQEDGDTTLESDEPSTTESEEDLQAIESGIVKFVLHKVKYLSTSTSITGSLSPSAELFVDSKKVKSYRTLRHMNEPSWEDPVEILIPSKRTTEFTLKIYDERFSGKELICEFSAPFEELLNIASSDSEYLTGSPQGEIYFTAVWKPVNLPEGTMETTQQMVSPLGVIRMHIREASVQGELEGVGDIDPYFVISADKSVLFRSNFFSDQSNPKFNNLVYVPITSPNQTVTLDLYDYQKIGKDRFIGSCHFKAANIMEKDPGTDKYVPSGSADEVLEWVLSDKSKRATRSIVTASVSFIPAVPVYAPYELARVEELEKKVAENEEKFEAEQATLREEMEKNPAEYEVVEIEVDDKATARLGQKEKMSFEKLVSHNSGVLSFRIPTGKLTKSDAFLQVLFDDFSYPAATSSRARTGTVLPLHGEFFVRDLKHSIITFRVAKRQIIKNPDDIISEYTFQTLSLLEKGYEHPTTVDVKGSTVDICFMYTPSAVPMPSSESVLDTGFLELQVVSAEDVPSHDRNGLSDPFTIIKVDGTKIFKSEVIKKTLTPVWNARTNIPIPSRTRSKVDIEVYDWDRSGSNDILSKCSLPLEELVPNQEKAFSLKLRPQGIIHLKGRFVPEYIRPAVNVGEGGFASMPFKAVGTVANIGKGVAGVGVGAAVNVASFGVGTAVNVADFGIGGLQKGGRLLKGIGGFGSSTPKQDHSSKSGAEKQPAPNAIPNNSYVPVERQHTVLPNSSGTANEASGEPNKQKLSDTTRDTANETAADDACSIGGAPGPIPRRQLSQASVFTRSLAPNSIYSGTVTLVSAENLGKTVQLRISLTKDGKLKHLYRTEKQKADVNGVCTFQETCDFQAPPEASLIFGAVAHHTFSKDTNLGIAQVALNDSQIRQDGQILIKLGPGHLIFKLSYGKDVPPVPVIPTAYQEN
ncbi:AER148Wp [Eremothecium gossypii ATCC 10895]|uniref:AER148Wp n=1 Tax=Eremothecium gossypii (strain ATCC 10895 / CBS 109.51 / FGSC 9923 / NRRL Y-1056) TaxID=284811 RepID=Q756V3_EREGS|nr:AER148Wp [Eremothecium gossypii ATCC 10895]AAS52831.1 AER148Wp [Eremothecium gossypii ATCC 10895]AEY97137.1 FAER148Wp [Eremothecium gossypii FDAG1]